MAPSMNGSDGGRGGALFVPQDAARTQFAGFLRVGDDEFLVRIRGVRLLAAAAAGDAEGRPRVALDGASVEAEPPLAALLAAHASIIKVRLQQAPSLEAFMRELEELVAVSAAPASVSQLQGSSHQALPDAAYYTRLMDEVDAVGWHHLTYLSDDLRVVELQAQDAGGRSHAVRVTLSPDYPLTAPRCAVDAPGEFQLSWPAVLHHRHAASSRHGRSTTATLWPHAPTLKTVLDQFELFLNEFQAFWNVLDEVDATCCVLEPQHPSRATGRRRLALQRHVSVQIEVDAAHPRGICELTFFGSEATVAPLRDRWSDHLFEWEDHRSLPQNLELLLDVELPSPATTATDTFALECGICYCYRLDVEPQDRHEASASPTALIPDRLCENPKCNRPFHEKCLFEWLKALPTARQSFSTVFGECPYCREAISAKFTA